MLLMVKSAKKVKQVAVAILAMLSLSTSSIAACACSHHTDPKPEKSCHGPAHHKSNTDVRVPAYGQNCSCFVAATELSVKAESFKFKKHVAGSRSAAMVAPTVAVLVRSILVPELAVSFYDRLLYSAPFSRGPPVG